MTTEENMLQLRDYIAGELRAARARQRLNVLEMAAKSGISHASITSMENMNANPNLQKLVQLANALGKVVKIEIV